MTDEERAAAAKAEADAKAKADADAKAKEGKEEWRNVDEVKKIIAQRDAATAEAKANAEAARELAELKKAQMTDAEKAQARIKELEGYESQAKSAEAVLSRLFDGELEAVPEAMRGIVKGATVAEKLDHLRELKAAGVFGKQAGSASQGAGAPGGTSGNTITKSALANMPPSERRNAILADVRAGKVAVIDG